MYAAPSVYIRCGLSKNASHRHSQINMPTEKTKRSAIYLALCAGRGAQDIAVFLDVPKSLVYHIKSNFDAFNGTEEEREEACISRKTKDAFKPIRTNEFVDDIKQRVLENRSTTMCSLAREKGVAYSTVWKTVRQDIGLKSYRLRRAQLLTPKQKDNRYAKAVALLNNVKHETAGMLRFFSDEKNFTQEQKSTE